jgi:hypothetical protein
MEKISKKSVLNLTNLKNSSEWKFNGINSSTFKYTYLGKIIFEVEDKIEKK